MKHKEVLQHPYRVISYAERGSERIIGIAKWVLAIGLGFGLPIAGAVVLDGLYNPIYDSVVPNLVDWVRNSTRLGEVVLSLSSGIFLTRKINDWLR